MSIDPAWVAVSVLFITSVGGWSYSLFRNGRNQSEKFGRLYGKVDGLGDRISSLESSISDLNGRIDNLVISITDSPDRGS